MTRKEKLIIGSMLAVVGLATVPYIWPFNLLLCGGAGILLGEAVFKDE